MLRLSFANLKRKKSLTATLLLLSLLATLFLSMGFSICEQIEQIYIQKAREMNAPDLFVMAENAKYQTIFENALKEDERVDYVEKEEIIYMENTENSANALRIGAIIFNKDTQRRIEPFHIIKEDITVSEKEGIYLPLIMESSGASLGEEYIITYKGVDYSFRIAGFFETTYMGTTSNSFMKYFVSDSTFQRLYAATGSGTALSVKVQETLDVREASKAVKDDFLQSTDFYGKIGGIAVIGNCLSYEDMEEVITALYSVPMMIIIAFAFIICVIICVVVHFKVKEEIEESLPDIGSLQAMGYTTGQIMLSVIGEFAITAIGGGTVGVLLAGLLVPLFNRYGEGITGITSQMENAPWINLCAVLLFVLIVICSTLPGVWKIKKIPPVTAFRKGIKTHHFGKNLFPLQKGIGGVCYRLALKNIASNLRQNITTVIVIALGVFAIGISVVLYMNFAYDNSAVSKMTGIEVSDIQVKLLPHVDAFSFQKELESMEEVRKTNIEEQQILKVDGEDVLFTIGEDFSKMEVIVPTKGDIPIYDNEVVLTLAIMRKLNKKMGDTVQIEMEGIHREYYIVGVIAGSNNGGKMGMMRLEGIRRIRPYFTPSQIDIYVKEQVSSQALIEKLYQTYGTADRIDVVNSLEGDFCAAEQIAREQMKKLQEQYGMSSVAYAVMLDGEIILSGDSSPCKIKEITSLSEYLEGQLKSYATMMSGMVTLILLIMFVIIGAIITITIKSLLYRQKEEFGIYKALGYTTKDLVKIIRLNFLVNAILGAIVGGVFCKLTANRLLGLFFSNMGMDLAAFKISSLWILVIGILVIGYIWLLVSWKAYRVKKITVYHLLSYSLLVSILLVPVQGVLAKENVVMQNVVLQTEKKTEESYGIGSVSKVFTAACIMRLVDLGSVDLDAPVTEYIPEFTMADERYRNITVRMLLNHSSGIRGTTYHNCFLMDYAEVDYHKTLLDTLKNQTLKAEPGEYGVYCNDGFTLAEIIIERVSGVSFAEFVQREFVEPLGLTNTFMPTAITAQMALSPIYDNNRKLPYQNIQSLASGGIYSTARDLCRFAQIFMENQTDPSTKILSEEAVMAMAASEYRNSSLCLMEGDNSFTYGLGWDSVDTYPYAKYGIKAWQKGGDTGKYGATLLVLPKLGLSISVTASGGESQYCQMMSQAIAKNIVIEKGLLTQEQTDGMQIWKELEEQEPQKIPQKLKEYEGVYASAELIKAEFTDTDTLLLSSLENGSDMVQEYKYTKSGEFVSTQGKYLFSTGLAQTERGMSGLTSFVFKQEENGKTYIMGTTYMTAEGKIQLAVTAPFAEKISKNNVSDKVMEVWNHRNGTYYYLVSEVYQSTEYLNASRTKTELVEEYSGYTAATERAKNCRITDENHAVCELDLPVMIGRDLTDYRFWQQDGKEYLTMESCTYIEEDALSPSSELFGEITAGKEGQWYKVTQEDAGKEIVITTTGKNSYYIYDRNHNCVAASLLPGEKETVLLPENGSVLLVGEEGSVFTITQ